MENELCFETVCRHARSSSGFSGASELFVLNESSVLIEKLLNKECTALVDPINTSNEGFKPALIHSFDPKKLATLINTILMGPYDGFFAEALTDLSYKCNNDPYNTHFLNSLSDIRNILIAVLMSHNLSTPELSTRILAVNQLIDFCMAILSYQYRVELPLQYQQQRFA